MSRSASFACSASVPRVVPRNKAFVFCAFRVFRVDSRVSIARNIRRENIKICFRIYGNSLFRELAEHLYQGVCFHMHAPCREFWRTASVPRVYALCSGMLHSRVGAR
jgi:hypothetical protein